MRHIAATRAFREGFLEMLPACVGLVPFGLVCGVGAAAAGADLFAAFGMSAFIFSGAAQILAAQLLAAGAPIFVIVLTCFVAGLRFLMYSAAMAPHLSPLPLRWQRSLPFLMSDQVFAAVIRRFEIEKRPLDAGRYFLGAGIALWATWQVANLAGYLVGNQVPASWQLEFAVPLCFIALIAPHLRTTPTVSAAVVGGVAVMLLAWLPMKLNLVLAGLLGIAAGTLVDLGMARWRSR